MNLTWLRSFLAVAEALSFSKASVQLGISQPTLSHQIRLLEETLGLDLLDRSTHHVRLTATGRTILAANRRIFSEIDALQRLGKELRDGLTGEIAIGTVPSVGTYILPSYLERYREQLPAIRISILSKPHNEILRLLQEGEIDVALVTTFGEEVFPQLESIVVHESELVFICGPRCQNRCPNYDRNHLKFTELAWERIIYFDEQAPEQQAILRAFATRGLHIKPALESEQIETIKKMAEVGIGCAILPAFAVQEEIKSGRLTRKAWFCERLPLKVIALSRPKRTPLRTHEAFLSLFQKHGISRIEATHST